VAGVSQEEYDDGRERSEADDRGVDREDGELEDNPAPRERERWADEEERYNNARSSASGKFEA